MKTPVRILIVVATLVLSLTIGATAVFAAPGGMPAAHGVDGETFGGLVSDLAQSEPGAIANHVAGCTAEATSMAGGMPAAHGVDGATFGSLVSALAQSGPGAVAGHVAGCE